MQEALVVALFHHPPRLGFELTCAISCCHQDVGTGQINQQDGQRSAARDVHNKTHQTGCEHADHEDGQGLLSNFQDNGETLFLNAGQCSITEWQEFVAFVASSNPAKICQRKEVDIAQNTEAGFVDQGFDHGTYITRPLEPKFAHTDVGEWDVGDDQKGCE